MLRQPTLTAAAGLIALGAVSASAFAQPSSSGAVRPRQPRAIASPRPAPAGFRFIETRPGDLRITGHILRLTEQPVERPAGPSYPVAARTGPLATALTPLQVPDPRLDWLARCINHAAADLSPAALSVSPGWPTLLPDGPGLTFDGFASAR